MKQTTAILLAAYNGEKYLKEQLDSIVGQTFTDWALFINDDGSTDSTPEILRQYQNMYPDQIFFPKTLRELMEPPAILPICLPKCPDMNIMRSVTRTTGGNRKNYPKCSIF